MECGGGADDWQTPGGGKPQHGTCHHVFVYITYSASGQKIILDVCRPYIAGEEFGSSNKASIAIQNFNFDS